MLRCYMAKAMIKKNSTRMKIDPMTDLYLKNLHLKEQSTNI